MHDVSSKREVVDALVQLSNLTCECSCNKAEHWQLESIVHKERFSCPWLIHKELFTLLLQCNALEVEALSWALHLNKVGCQASGELCVCTLTSEE